MKKYVLVSVMLCMGAWLHAADTLVFNTVLSKPVGSFWEVATTTCAYPDVSGGPGTSQSEQVVVNFGPTGRGGTINLNGGPMKVDTLLMEDDSTLTLSPNVKMLFDTSNGKLTIYPGGNLPVNSILIDTLYLPKDTRSTIDVSSGTTRLKWSGLKVNTLIMGTGFGGFKLTPSSTTGTAKFQDIPKGSAETSAPPANTWYLRLNN